MAGVEKIFALGAKTQAIQLTYKDFEGNFSETTFMDQATRFAMLKEPAPGDPPLDISRIRECIINAKDQIVGVQHTLEMTISKQYEACDRAQETLRKDSETLAVKSDELNTLFEGIDSRYINVLSSTVNVGKSLSILNKQKERATKARDILSNFMDFQEDEEHMKEMLLSNDTLLKGSTALEQLTQLCEGLENQKYHTVRDRIDSRVQSVVNNLMESLQKATMENDMQTLATVTSCLSTFQRGSGVYQMYASAVVTRMQSELPELKPDNSMSFDEYLFLVIDFFSKAKTSFMKEINAVYSVFEREVVVTVMVALMHRFFDDPTFGVQPLLQYTQSLDVISRDNKFELLAHTRQYSIEFIKDVVTEMKAKEKESVGHSERVTRDEPKINEAFESAFLNHLEGYVEEELQTLDENFKSAAANSVSINIRPQSSKSEMLKALKQMMPNGSAAEQIQEIVLTSLSPIVILELMNIASRTLDRMTRMSVGDSAIHRVCELLFQAITDYIVMILDVVVVANNKEYGASQLPGSSIPPPNVALLDTIHTLNGVVHCAQQKYIEMFHSRVTEGSKCEKKCAAAVRSMYVLVESRLSSILQELLRQVNDFTTQELDGVSRNGLYQPPANVGVTRATDVCIMTCGWLKRHMESARKALDGANLDQYGDAVVQIFQRNWMVSLQKVKKVTGPGMSLIEIDCTAYEEALLSLQNESAKVTVRVMKKLIHLASVPVGILKSNIQDNDLLSIDRQYILHLLKLRPDFYKSEEVRQLHANLASLI